MYRMLRFVAPALVAFLTLSATAQAATYDCTPKAIATKSAFVTNTFKDFVAGKWTGKGTFGPVLGKIWDGKGDCDTNGDSVGKLPPEAQLNVIKTHYYGDIMSISVHMGAKDYKEARGYMDDFNGVHGAIVGPMKSYFAGSFMTQDKDFASEMKSVDGQLTKLGFKPAQ